MDVISKEDIDKLKENLKHQGYKLTPQRRAVLDVVIYNEGKHLSTEEIYDIVKKGCPEIGLATVYRTLLLFEKIGTITRVNFGDGCNRYELVHKYEDHHHHHLICLSCNCVEEVEDDLLEELEANIRTKHNFEIVNHNVKFYGYCAKCREKMLKK